MDLYPVSDMDYDLNSFYLTTEVKKIIVPIAYGVIMDNVNSVDVNAMANTLHVSNFFDF